MNIPFNFLPPIVLDKFSRLFKASARVLENAFPTVTMYVEQSELGHARDYYAKAVAVTVSYALLIFFVLLIVGNATSDNIRTSILIALTASLLLSFLVWINLLLYPKIMVTRKIADLEKNWIFALRTLLVTVRSGLSLFNGLTIIAGGNYGSAAKEIKKAVDKMNFGTPEDKALEEMASKNPSPFFRRSVWQIINGMEAGTDISLVLKEVVEGMVAEEKNEIRKYGSRLGMLSLIYVMIGVIIPALGITFLIVLSNFPQINITDTLFYVLLAGIILVQFMYIGLMKSARPAIMG